MSEVTFLPGVSQKRVKTDRLEMAYLEAGEPGAIPVVLVHGNLSCGWFFQELMLDLKEYHVFAPDMRGYGHTQTLPVDATRGMGDFSDDLFSFGQSLGLESFHLLGWSLGGSIVMQYAIDHPETLRSLVLQAPGSPYGFGGNQGVDGKLNFPDGAGSGGGLVNPDFLKRLKEGDRSADSETSPRNIMNFFYFKPPFKVSPEREEIYVSAILATSFAEGNYPGDAKSSANWPGIAPGGHGPNNALAPIYPGQAALAEINPKPDIMWIRGENDQIVADMSLFDFGTLGQLGAIPGWPGADVCPPQPMLAQTRHVLDKYRQNGGLYTETVLPNCGHSPHIEKQAEVSKLLHDFLAAH